MMRIIKLIILVFVVAGIIVGIMFLPPIIDDFGRGGVGGSGIYADLANDIKQRWEQSGATWSMDDYNKLRADIDVCTKKLTGNDYRTLRQSNANAAVNVLHKSMMTAFEQNASETDIRKLKGDVAELKNDTTNQLENNEKVEECEGTYKLHQDILEYGRTNFNFSPGLKVYKDTVTFTEFSVHKINEKGKGDKFKSSQYYGRIKNRHDVDENTGAFKNVDDKLSKAEDEYPTNVANAIKAEFNKRDYTQENLRLLQCAYNGFKRNGYSNGSLLDFLNSFKKNVEKKLEEEKEEKGNSPNP